MQQEANFCFPFELGHRFLEYGRILTTLQEKASDSTSIDQQNEFWKLLYHYKQLQNLIEWFLEDCVPKDKLDRRSLILYSDGRDTGKTYLIEHCFSREKNYCATINGSFPYKRNLKDYYSNQDIVLLDNIGLKYYQNMKETLTHRLRVGRDLGNFFEHKPIVYIPLGFEEYEKYLNDGEINRKLVFVNLKESLYWNPNPEWNIKNDKAFVDFRRGQSKTSFQFDIELLKKLEPYLFPELKLVLTPQESELFDRLRLEKILACNRRIRFLDVKCVVSSPSKIKQTKLAPPEGLKNKYQHNLDDKRFKVKPVEVEKTCSFGSESNYLPRPSETHSRKQEQTQIGPIKGKLGRQTQIQNKFSPY